MINDENRREVAAIIRDMFKYECKYKVEFFDLLRDALDQEFDIVLGFDNMAEILAALIDRPTCRKLIPDEMEGLVFCSNCGAEIGEYGVPNYCHNCGAEVKR